MQTISRQARHAPAVVTNGQTARERTPTGFVGFGVLAEREVEAGKLKSNTMKKTLTALTGLALIACGCNTTNFTASKPDGTKVSITNSRLFWTTDSYSASLKGDEATLSANKSKTDTEAIGAVVTAAVSAAAKSVKP